MRMETAAGVLGVKSNDTDVLVSTVQALRDNGHLDDIAKTAFDTLWSYQGFWSIPENSDKKPKHEQTNQETTDKFNQVSRAISSMAGVQGEVCGNWIWIRGDTKPYAKELKALGLRFGRKKQAWYWHPPGYRKRGRKTYSMQEIREKYGSRDLEDN